MIWSRILQQLFNEKLNRGIHVNQYITVNSLYFRISSSSRKYYPTVVTERTISRFFLRLQLSFIIMNLPFTTRPGRTFNPFCNVKNARHKHSHQEDGDILMRQIDALEAGFAATGTTSLLRSQSKSCIALTKPVMLVGAGNVIPDCDLSSIGSQQETEDDEMFLCVPSSRETQPHVMLTPNATVQTSVFSLTPRKTNELSLLSIPKVSPMLPKKIAAKCSQKRKRDFTS